MKPLIAMFGNVKDDGAVSLFSSYSNAIEAAGGIPVIVPYADKKATLGELLARCDAYFFTGGADIHPSRYGEECSPHCGETQPLRDELELAAFPTVFATGKPILGVCRGHQLINVALGGTLCQDLPGECPTGINHRQSAPKTEPSHEIVIAPNTPLAALIGKERMMGNSFHHQAVKTLGKELAVMATAEDGTVEATYHVSHPYLRSYQWHPERLSPFDGDNLRLFADFVSACRQ